MKKAIHDVLNSLYFETAGKPSQPFSKDYKRRMITEIPVNIYPGSEFCLEHGFLFHPSETNSPVGAKLYLYSLFTKKVGVLIFNDPYSKLRCLGKEYETDGVILVSYSNFPGIENGNITEGDLNIVKPTRIDSSYKFFQDNMYEQSYQKIVMYIFTPSDDYEKKTASGIFEIDHTGPRENNHPSLLIWRTGIVNQFRPCETANKNLRHFRDHIRAIGDKLPDALCEAIKDKELEYLFTNGETAAKLGVTKDIKKSFENKETLLNVQRFLVTEKIENIKDFFSDLKKIAGITV